MKIHINYYIKCVFNLAIEQKIKVTSYANHFYFTHRKLTLYFHQLTRTNNLLPIKDPIKISS